mgnify:CR=1 FL=1
MTSESSNEPRKVPLRIRLPFATEDEFIERYGVNVTRGGIFIATKHGKPEGTQLSIELVLQTRGREHIAEVIRQLQAQGFEAALV